MFLSRSRRRGAVVLAFATIAAFTVSAPAAGTSNDVPIYDIQGAGHISPYNNVEVTTTGVVTAIGFRSYYVQDPAGDGDDATSDGIFVFDSRSSTFALIDVGSCVRMTDFVTEFIPGGAGTGNLSITQMSFPEISIIEDCDWEVPAPTVIGLSGRVPPNEIVISDAELPVNLQTMAGTFNPAVDGIDFYESLEGMLVTVEKPQAVSAIRQFGTFSAEFFTVPNGARKAIIEPDDAITRRRGIFLQPDLQNRGDQNPERVQIQFTGTLYQGNIFSLPAIQVGDRFDDITGVVGYSFGNFEVNVIEALEVADSSDLGTETTDVVGDGDRVTLASYNLLNLSADGSDTAQAALLGDQIANALGAPDVIALQEIQDNNGTTNDGTTAADLTLKLLLDSISAAGGPTYVAFDVAPVDGTQGGVPGGNIRNAFLYNPARVGLVGFTALDAAELATAGADPTAFNGTRTPLVGTFSFNGKEFTVINVHHSSRFGSTPIFGGPQPFVQAGEPEREAQVGAVNQYVDYLLGMDADANVVVAGDFNTFQWTDELLEDLPGTEGVLTNLVSTDFARTDLYSFIFEGNSQVLDHIFVTDGLLKHAKFDVVHLNVDFPRRFGDTVASDHEPLVASFKLK